LRNFTPVSEGEAIEGEIIWDFEDII